MDIAITKLVQDKPLVIFTKSNCCMSYSIKTLLSNIGANPTIYEVDQVQNGVQIERVLMQLGGQPSVPAVFIGQEYVGGANAIITLNARNELVPLLLRARAIWI